MRNFKFGPTTIAEWKALVVDAQGLSGYEFNEDMENYLVITLDQFTQQVDLGSTVIAIDYLNSNNLSGKSAAIQLRHVGDQCLLLSGLFPERAYKKNVSLDYFINVGQSAYSVLAMGHLTKTFDHALFLELSKHFVGLMDVLHAMRLMKTPPGLH